MTLALAVLAGCGDADPGDSSPPLAPDAGLDLGEERDAGSPPAEPDAGPPVLRCDDAYEPNDRADQAPLLASGRWRGLRICPGDEDHFRLDLRQGEPFDLRIAFRHAEGDLDLLFVEEGSGRMLRSGSGDDDERIEGRTLGEGPYRLVVMGFRGGAAGYDLILKLGEGCEDEAAEPGGDVALARPLGPGLQAGMICPADEDWFRVERSDEQGLRAQLRFLQAEGDLTLELLRPLPSGALESVAVSRGTGDTEALSLRAEALGAAGPVYLRVAGEDGASAAYELQLELPSLAEQRAVVVAGSVERADLPVLPEGYGELQWLPAARVEVELLRAADDFVLATGSTDEQGLYRLDAQLEEPTAVYVRALASWRGAGGATVRVSTQARSALLHAWAAAPVQAEPGGEPLALDLRVPAAAGPAGAFNVAAVVGEGFGALGAKRGSGSWAHLDVRWEPGVVLDCGSCYFDGRIDLGGGPDDPDEFDDGVILHEMGHFVADNLSRDDSPGGAHDGSRADPRLAWSEGWATFFGSFVRQDPLYLDYRLTGVRLEDLESRTEPETYGTDDGLATGDLSEDLVSAVLWDLFDERPDDDDPVADGARVLDPVFGYLASNLRRDRAPRGTDFQDYLDGYLCQGIGPWDLLSEVLEGRALPYDPSTAPLDCAGRRKPGSPAQAWLEPRGPSAATLWLRSEAAVPRAELRVLGEPARELGPLAAARLYSWPLQAAAGEPLRAGVMLYLAPGRRLHVVAEWPREKGEARMALPSLTPQPRRTVDGHGRPLLQWARQ